MIQSLFESIAKTNTTHTAQMARAMAEEFESIAKTNTTHTLILLHRKELCLRVLLKQIQHTRGFPQHSK